MCKFAIMPALPAGEHCSCVMGSTQQYYTADHGLYADSGLILSIQINPMLPAEVINAGDNAITEWLIRAFSCLVETKVADVEIAFGLPDERPASQLIDERVFRTQAE